MEKKTSLFYKRFECIDDFLPYVKEDPYPKLWDMELSKLLSYFEVSNTMRVTAGNTGCKEFRKTAIAAVSHWLVIQKKGLEMGDITTMGVISSISENGTISIQGKKGSFSPLSINKIEE